VGFKLPTLLQVGCLNPLLLFKLLLLDSVGMAPRDYSGPRLPQVLVEELGNPDVSIVIFLI
jgi:hypothetical protein